MAEERAGWTERWPPEILLVIAIAMAVVIAAPLNPDTGYTLVAGRRLLHGDRLYVDMMETNPPMIFWITAALGFVGRYLPLSDARLTGAFVAALILACSLLGLAVLGAPRPSRSWRFCLFSGFLVALVLPFVMWTGQREQVAALLVFPYTLLAVHAARGLRVKHALAIGCGALAAVGFAIKPFFLAAWVACELAVFADTRRWPSRGRTEFWTVVLLQGVFGAAVLTVTREYLANIVPLARAFYGAYGRSYMSFVQDKTTWILALVGIVAVIAPQAGKTFRALPYGRVFGATALGWLAAYVMQAKGWYYQLIPAIAFGTAALFLTVGSLIASLRETPASRARRTFAAVAAVIVIVAGAAALPPIQKRSIEALQLLRYGQSAEILSLASYVERAAAGEPVYFLSTNVWPAFPVVNLAGATWPYHYHFLWPIPALYARRGDSDVPYRLPDAQGPLERQFFDTVVGDLTRTPPRVLVVGQSAQQAMGGRRFDFVEYFTGSPEFRRLLARYEKRSTGDWDIYERVGR